MKLLGEVAQSFGGYDIQLYCSLYLNTEEAARTLECCLSSIVGWVTVNKPKLNPDKAEVLLVRRMSDPGTVIQLRRCSPSFGLSG